MKYSIISILASVMFLLFNIQSHAQSVEPGIWKDSSRFTVNGVPLPASENEECVTPEQAKDVKVSIVKALKKIGCALTKWKVTGARLEASLKCENEELNASGNLKGQFSKKSYELNGEAAGTIKEILPATATVKLRGEWVRPCKP